MEQFFLRPPHHPQLKSLVKEKKKSLAKEREILPEKKTFNIRQCGQGSNKAPDHIRL